MKLTRTALPLAVLALGALLVPERSLAQLAAPRVVFRTVLQGLAEPVFVGHAGDGSGRLFVIEKRGTIRIVRNGALLPAPFLDIQARVLNAGEQGLLGLAFPPGFAASGRFYVYLTNRDGDNEVLRFRVGADPDRVDPATGEQILLSPHPVNGNHNGGMMAFGPDGFLYLATGDGGGGGDVPNNAQRLDTILGKLLRIDPETPATGYAIPAGNPFAATPGARPEIFHLGLRNPWRFSFDRATGDLFIGDVGQNAIEEIDFLPAGTPGGVNFGWRVLEGTACFPIGSLCVPPPNNVLPVIEYTHAEGCSVIGGYVSRSAAYPQIAGLYFFSDLCGGFVRAARNTSAGFETVTVLEGGGARAFTSFGESEDGSLFITDIGAGTLLRMVSPLFADTFDVPGPDPDWDTARGAWTATAEGAFVPDGAVPNLAFAAGAPASSVPAGRITAQVLLPAAPKANARLVFHALDAGRYRFVSLRPGSISIGQAGAFGRARAGIKRTFRAPVARNRPVRVLVDLAPDGTVRVRIGGVRSFAATFKFPRAVRGRVGLGANFSAPRFDNVTVWDRFALHPQTLDPRKVPLVVDWR